MLRNFCIILLSVFLICKVANVQNLLSAKKSIEKCDSENCENESSESEMEKKIDDQQLIGYFPIVEKKAFELLSTSAFMYTADYNNEIHRNLFSPPPELG